MPAACSPAPAPRPLRAVTIVAALAGLLDATYLLLYKLGVVGHLTCGLTGSCEVVQASRWATLGGVPVAAWGVVGYAMILLVAILGCLPHTAGARWIRPLLTALAAGAVIAAAYFTAIEAVVLHAWCRWCVGSAICSVIIGIATAGEWACGWTCCGANAGPTSATDAAP